MVRGYTLWMAAVMAAGAILLGGPLSAQGQTCQTYAAGVTTGNIADKDLDESSGLAASRKTPGVWWSHNDSGGKARIYALDEKGNDLGHFDVPGANAVDWEDIAAGPCPNGDPCLYIGDFGDNAEARKEITIYRIPEPSVDPSNPKNGDTAQAAVFTLTYPDGAHNCETLLVHPTTRDLILVTKESNNIGHVFRLAGSVAPGNATLSKVTTLNIGATGLFTGGDISPFGDQIALRTYSTTFLYAPAADGIPRDTNRIGKIPTPFMIQGEAVAYSLDGQHLLYTTERTPMPMYKTSCATKAEPALEPNVEPAAEPKAEPAPEPTTEPALEPKIEPALEPAPDASAEVSTPEVAQETTSPDVSVESGTQNDTPQTDTKVTPSCGCGTFGSGGNVWLLLVLGLCCLGWPRGRQRL